MRLPTSHALRTLAALALFAGGSAQADLLLLANQPAQARQLLAPIDSVDASLVPLDATALPDCCTYAGAVATRDPASGRGFAVANDSGSAATLHTYALVGPALLSSVALAPGMQVHALAWDADGRRLLALVATAEGVAIAQLDPASGASTPLTPAIADCCALRSGIATWIGGSGEFAFVGRDAAGDGAWILLRIALADGSSTRAALSEDIDFLAWSPDHGLLAGFTSAAAGIATRRAQLGSVASDGTVTAIGSGVAQCCAALAGVGERSGGFLYRIGMRLDSGAPALYRLALADGSGELLGDLAPDLLPNALFATDGAPVGPPPPPDIFRDGFEAASPVPAAVAPAGKSATGSNALRVAQLASGSAGAAGGAGEHLQHSSPSDGAKGLVEARAPVLVPGPRPALLGLLVLLLALGAQASLGRSTRRTR